MNDLIDFLFQNPICSFATIENGKPRVRPIGFQFFEHGRFYFITSNKKEVYRQIIDVPYAEFSSVSKDLITVRVRGSIVVDNDTKKKEIALANSPIARKKYRSAQNPHLELFYLHEGEAIMFDLSYDKQRTFRF